MLSFDTPGIAQEVEEHVHVKRVWDAHTWRSWSGLAPDGTPLFVRDISTQEIYALDLQLP